MISFVGGFIIGSILSIFCLCMLQATSRLDEFEERNRKDTDYEQN